MNEIRVDSPEPLLHYLFRAHPEKLLAEVKNKWSYFPHHLLSWNLPITINSNILAIITMNIKKFLQLSMFYSGIIHSFRQESSYNQVWNSRIICLYHGLICLISSPLGKLLTEKTRLQLGTQVCFIGILEPLLSTKSSINVIDFYNKYTQKYNLQ